jgi:serine/threonine protein kinase
LEFSRHWSGDVDTLVAMSNSDDQFEPQLDGFPSDAQHRHRQQSSRDSLEVLATQFAERVRRGEQPSIDQYLAAHPEYAEGIRELFPMVAALEQWKCDREATALRQQIPEEFEIEQLGDCRILREVGRGGMGVVFEALQGALKRRVAVKLLPWRFSMVPRWQERFEREAQTIARLQHANIVPIYSFGTHEGYAYYVMQYVEGVSLANVIRLLEQKESVVFSTVINQAAEGGAGDSTKPSLRSGAPRRGLRRDSWKSCARIGMQVAQALRYSHAEGVLHNDVKPANLLIDATGKVCVTDFGLAAEMNPAPEDGDGSVTGTVRYMAPERFNGESDQTSDLYSVGVTLYELVTRRAAFGTEDRTELIEKITRGNLEPLLTLDRTIPQSLALIIEKACAPVPADRYQSAAELGMDLQRFINDEPISIKPEASGLSRWLPWRR